MATINQTLVSIETSVLDVQRMGKAYATRVAEKLAACRIAIERNYPLAHDIDALLAEHDGDPQSFPQYVAPS